MDKLIKKQTLLVLIGLGVFLSYVFFIWYPKAQDAHQYLTVEFQKITPLLQSEEVYRINQVQYTSADVGARYYTNLEMDIIFEHYHEELIRLGWKYSREKPYVHRGVEMEEEGKRVVYRKGGYSAEITHIGGDPTFDYTYSVNFAWGTTSTK